VDGERQIMGFHGQHLQLIEQVALLGMDARKDCRAPSRTFRPERLHFVFVVGFVSFHFAELQVEGSKIVSIFADTGPLVRQAASMLGQGLHGDPARVLYHLALAFPMRLFVRHVRIAHVLLERYELWMFVLPVA
jgi:hypothetical protein